MLGRILRRDILPDLERCLADDSADNGSALRAEVKGRLTHRLKPLKALLTEGTASFLVGQVLVNRHL